VPHPLPTRQVLVPEAIAALEEREAALGVAERLRERLAEREAAAAAAAAAARPRPPAPFAGADVPLAELQERARAAEAQYDALRARNLAELARLDLSRGDGFGRALGALSRAQAALAAAVVEAWSAAAERAAPAF
jgi:hypothetical protein